MLGLYRLMTSNVAFILHRVHKSAAPASPIPLLESANVKERPPPFVNALWDENGKVCILAKIEASFTITYDTKYGD